jgi:N-hydroxyarylamine O-acetyltransferase
VTLSGDELVRTEDGQRTVQRLGSDAEVLAAYERLFGIRLERVPRSDAVVSRSRGD